VRDTGPGIAPENLPKLFDNFYTSGKSGGTGLGLAYCKRTMQALDGDIYCQSKLGEHTAFRLSFPDLAVPKLA
jgi:signal transduction histidine kinase